MNDIKTHILNSSSKLNSYVEVIEKITAAAIEKINRKLPVESVDIVIYENRRGAIPEIGIGSITIDPNVVFVSLDSKHKNFSRNLNDHLPRTLAHELHHAMRWRGSGYGKNLSEALITEGLSDHFALEVFGGRPAPWCTALTEKQKEKLLEKAKKEFFNKDYKHHSWFYGKGNKSIPRWTGYTLGFEIVKDYLEKNLQQKPSTLVNIEAQEIIKDL